MKLVKELRKQSFDLIEGQVRNHKPQQLWLKKGLNRAEFFSADVNQTFNSQVQLTEIEDASLSVNANMKESFKFNIGVTVLDDILESLGMGALEISANIKSGKEITISYDNSISKIIPINDVINYFSTADFKYPNPVLLKELNNNNLLIITGVIFAKNLNVEIETDFKIDSELVAKITELADGKIDLNLNSENKIKMVSGGNNYFPVAVKASRVDYDKGRFKGLTTVTDNRNFF